MKQLRLLVTFIAVMHLISFVPVSAAETDTMEQPDVQTQQKDRCLLVAKNCGTTAISIQDKIERLKEEIAKGRAVYTPEELELLEKKLDEVSKRLDFLLER